MNHFLHGTAAGRYAKSRPPHHAVVVGRIKRLLRVRGLSRRALDVGCGTGMSTVALRIIARNVVGVDTSRNMLVLAQRAEGVRYVLSAAEALPFADETFKIATVSSAFHWFDRERFLPEAARVLGPGGWLIIYNNAFRAVMRENPAFHDAFEKTYPKRYPTPVRDWRQMTAEQAERYGFEFRSTEDYVNDVEFSLEELVSYLTTQSNIIAAVEGGSETIESVIAWLAQFLAPLFPDKRATFEFGGRIWYLRKLPARWHP